MYNNIKRYLSTSQATYCGTILSDHYVRVEKDLLSGLSPPSVVDPDFFRMPPPDPDFDASSSSVGDVVAAVSVKSLLAEFSSEEVFLLVLFVTELANEFVLGDDDDELTSSSIGNESNNDST